MISVSVVIPAYNSEATIARAIDSVLTQARPADQIIVVDDGSTDKTAEIVQSYGRTVLLLRQENAGVSVARNAGINAATGEWIAFLDADDEWMPEKLRLQAEHLQRHPDLKWTYSNFYRKESQIKDLQLAHTSSRLMVLLKEESFQDYFLAYINYAYAWTSTIVVNRTLFKTVGMFEPGMRRAQDNDLWYRIAYQYPQVGYLREPLAIYHLGTPGSSTKINDSVDFMIGLIRRHENLSKQHNRYEAFRPCITQMVQNWIRQLEKQGRYKDAARILNNFVEYSAKRFKNEMKFRLLCPPLTTGIADSIIMIKKNLRGG